MKLLITIPALNEEASIQQTIEHCLEAKDAIIRNSPVTDIEITVVSDGSTDRTVAIARHYRDRIRLIVFRTNRGYGAAIKKAWYRSDADLLGFLDADGTCDPFFFADLCRALEDQRAEIVLGSRLNNQSKMPVIRRIGNLIFGLMLSLASSRTVKDAASGMRVVRRSVLPKIMPLPDGLHFTPAMSARAILSRNIKIIEIPMTYHERRGQSKLKIGKDGFRFLKAIAEATFLYRSVRPMAITGIALVAIAGHLMVPPIVHYLRNRTILEWMIYRFVTSNLLGASGVLFLCTGYLSQKVTAITLESPHGKRDEFISDFFSSRLFWVVPALLLAGGAILVFPSFIELVQTGATYEHWSRFIAMSFLFECAAILITTKAVDYILSLIADQLSYLKSQNLRRPVNNTLGTQS